MAAATHSARIGSEAPVCADVPILRYGAPRVTTAACSAWACAARARGTGAAARSAGRSRPGARPVPVAIPVVRVIGGVAIEAAERILFSR
jgi:hypothetical protein